MYSLRDGKLQLLTKEFTGPNGIAFSPDERYLYIGNWDDRMKTVTRFEVNPDGSVKNGELFFDFTAFSGEDAIDRIKVDAEGNLYISGPGGLHIISAKGFALDRLLRRSMFTILPGATMIKKLSIFVPERAFIRSGSTSARRALRELDDR